MSATLPGPYFSGQLPSQCGHYYPDVLRLRDEKRPDGRLVRIIDCTYCGRYELDLDPQTLDKGFVRKLNKKGCDVAIRDDEIAEARKRDFEKLFSKENSKKQPDLKLQSILEEALEKGADSIELEYVSEGLEVSYMLGNIGVGRVIKNRRVIGEIASGLIEQAKLQHKRRGTLAWTYRGKPYKIQVEEYESFGESAFRLIFKTSKRQRP